MKDRLYNILTHANKDIDNQKLMDYLSGKLSGQERHEIEKLMSESEFMNDAMEGLEKIPDTQKLHHYLEQLDKGLKKQLQHKKKRREMRRLKEYPWLYVAIVLVLLLCVAAFLVIRQYLK